MSFDVKNEDVACITMKSIPIVLFLFICISLRAQTGVDTAGYITIGGIRQYISIKGSDASKPLLLFLHGGPGGSVMSYADKFTNLLREKFIVVLWDQRETGKTLQINASPVPLTLDLFEKDTHDVIGYLLNKFKRPKLYLAGHSWGTVLGFFIADHYPEFLYAYIPISPVVDQSESEKISLNSMKEQARKTGNTIAIHELATVKIPFENGEQIYFHRKWLFYFNHQTVKKFTRAYALSWSATWLPVWNEASGLNLIKSLPAIHCPVYFFVGRKDNQTNARITETYFEKVVAPQKKIFWFEKSGHSIPTTEPSLLQHILIEKILPETFK